jgi:hypothetical protein
MDGLMTLNTQWGKRNRRFTDTIITKHFPLRVWPNCLVTYLTHRMDSYYISEERTNGICELFNLLISKCHANLTWNAEDNNEKNRLQFCVQQHGFSYILPFYLISAKLKEIKKSHAYVRVFFCYSFSCSSWMPLLLTEVLSQVSE